MKKVMFEHEEGDVWYAVASEVADELDWPRRTRIVCRTNWIARVKSLATASRAFSSVGPHEMCRGTEGVAENIRPQTQGFGGTK